MIKTDPPPNILATNEVFQDPAQAHSVLSAIYYNMVNNRGYFTAGNITIYAGVCADEFIPYDPANQLYSEFYQNKLQATNFQVGDIFWSVAYKCIFQANAVIENVPMTNFADSIKNELIGEARFVRAFCNFYLVNFFGDIPIVTTTNWQKTNLLYRSNQRDVYDFILKDLEYARTVLPRRFTATDMERIIPGYFAVVALLARVYLYQKNWRAAEAASGELIGNTGLFSLVGLNDIFGPNNKEAIWQIKQLNTQTNLFAAPEGLLFIPQVKNSDIPPVVYLYADFLTSFDRQDRRRYDWIDSTKVAPTGEVYYYPHKYKVGYEQLANSYKEYHTVFRLAEQFLIRAEARLNLGNINGAVNDLNAIRTRGGLKDLPNDISWENAFVELIKERRIELFAEWGHRWLDLKRWSIAGSVLKPVKGSEWQEDDTLYPIPASEIIANPNLTQNGGY